MLKYNVELIEQKYNKDLGGNIINDGMIKQCINIKVVTGKLANYTHEV